MFYQNFKSDHLINRTFVNYSTSINNTYQSLNKYSLKLLAPFLKYKLPHPPSHSSLPKSASPHLLKSISLQKMESQYLINLLKYKPQYYNNQSLVSVWHRTPIFRRSAVMVLLFLGREGELRVILTKRSRNLKNFSGHISFPGGKVDNELESEFQCARRETEEEIGLNRNNQYLRENFGFEINHLKTLPSYLARTFLSVTPCVGFINWTDEKKFNNFEDQHIGKLILNPGESSSIFSVPLKDFLQPKPKLIELKECLKQSYIQTNWGGIPWKLRSFIFPVHNDKEMKWLQEIDDLSASETEDETHDDHEFSVRTRNCWGLTANILHDVAELIYNGKVNDTIGEEDLIWSLFNNGQMITKHRTDLEKKLINNTKGFSFKEVLGDDDFQRLKTLYYS